MIRHMVFLNYAEDMAQDMKDAILRDLAALQTEIDGIEAFHAHANMSPETHFIHGFTEVFWFDFRDAGVRDAYLANDTHTAIGRRIMAGLNDDPNRIFVCDVAL
ncbi:Dabb family protein [Roseibaca sp. Y0-43]|uniref:Dabb family protein n=1 Tax=Roseibaca sp. Y0-43 TaxID=2816854 RepID=UPI001D0C5EA9|nr:Dabb family protein [Roseibaca sp. Y0-43]MCC1482288.1 Dabb family protein [Roseibaca sp. Y0-43]